jgi:hypothetical protein
MNQNEIMEITHPPVSQHPAELILAGIKEKLSAWEQEHQQIVQQLTSQRQQIAHLQSKVEEQGQEKKIWLTQLVAYWQREVDLLTLAQQMSGDITPEQKTELLARMQQLNQTNVKFASTHQKQSSWVKKTFYSLMALLLLILGAYGLWKFRHYLRTNPNH